MRPNFALILLFFCGFTFQTFAQKKEKIPRETQKSVPLMSDYITSKCSSERQKVDSIYAWIINNIDYDYAILESSKPFAFQGSTNTLKSKTAVCNGYVELLIDLLAVQNIKAEFVEGYTRSFDPTYKYVLFESDHAWIAIKIDGEWRLADPTWDAGYIGRIPKDVKTYPKRWDKEKTFKKEKKRTAWETKITKKKVDFDKAQSERDPYTNKIGFVRDTSLDYYLMDSDTFLLTHLPTLPEWQLRKHTISIEQFSQAKDSVRLEIENPEGEDINYENLIDEYIDKNIVEKWLYTAENGFKYNAMNHGVKAVNYYNTVGIHLDSDVKKILERYPDYKSDPIYNQLVPMADSAILHAKLALKIIKDSRKEKMSYYKDSFKKEATSQKTIFKQSVKVEKEQEKLENLIDGSNDKLKDGMDFIDEKLLKYQIFFNSYQKKGGLEAECDEVVSMMQKFDALNFRVDSIVKSMKNYRDNSAMQGYFNKVQEAKYYADYANAYVSIYSISVLGKIAHYDSLSIQSLLLAQSVIKDSVTNEIQSSDLISALKELDRFAKAKKKDLTVLEAENKIKSASAYDRVLFSKVYSQFKEYKQLSMNSMAYNGMLKRNLAIINRELKEVENSANILEKSRDTRNDKLYEDLDTSFERGENLYQMIIDKSGVWKKELKRKVK